MGEKKGERVMTSRRMDVEVEEYLKDAVDASTRKTDKTQIVHEAIVNELETRDIMPSKKAMEIRLRI